MKNLHELELHCTGLVARLKSVKAGSHSWKHSRNDSQETISARDASDEFLDWIRQEIIDIRDEISELIGR